jgi:polysaccharide export outer membrane protein
MLVTIIFFATTVSQAADYKLTTGDELYISVWGHEDLQQNVVVGPDGQISFPMIGGVQAEGLTIDQLTDLMVEKLQEYIKINDAQLNIVFRKYEQVKVMILGAVNQPGAYQVRPGDQVLDLLSLAGGTTKSAAMNNLKLRREEESLTVDLEAILDNKSAEDNYQLHEGDTLYVPEDVVQVSVLGAVKQPGSYKVEQGSRVSDVLAQAGGTTADAADKIKYITADKKKELSVSDLLEDPTMNPEIEDGATIQALESNFDFTKLSFWRNFFFIVGGLNGVKNLVE